jgi:uncharacterized membrane protein YqgA involved in biofilm formation
VSKQISAPAIVTHTPLWVWAVFAILLWRGLGATRDREVSAPRLAILPAVILGLAISHIVDTGLDAKTAAALVAGIALGVFAGIARNAAAAPTRLAPGRLRLHGEWITFCAVMVIFAIHYAAGVIEAIDPALARDTLYRVSTGALSAFLSTMTITVAVLRLRLAFAS